MGRECFKVESKPVKCTVPHSYYLEGKICLFAKAAYYKRVTGLCNFVAGSRVAHKNRKGQSS